MATVNADNPKDEHHLIPIFSSVIGSVMAVSAVFFGCICYSAINDKLEEYYSKVDDETPLTVMGDSSEI